MPLSKRLIFIGVGLVVFLLVTYAIFTGRSVST